MQWHYRLGHLTFPKLKQPALNGKIPRKLVKVLPPKCAGCLFSTMTKLPWQGKETKADHKVLVTTKPGECILVDQMTSMEVGFFAQLKGNLTKLHYKCVTVFADHYSHLHFVLGCTLLFVLLLRLGPRLRSNISITRNMQ
jgi:hypothetical protein